jgi:hypothetical protein
VWEEYARDLHLTGPVFGVAGSLGALHDKGCSMGGSILIAPHSQRSGAHERSYGPLSEGRRGP